MSDKKDTIQAILTLIFFILFLGLMTIMLIKDPVNQYTRNECAAPICPKGYKPEILQKSWTCVPIKPEITGSEK